MNLYRGIESFDEVPSSNPFHEENEMFNMLNNLHAPIDHEEKIEEGLENEMSFNIGVEQKTTNIFQKLLNEARNKQHPDCCLEFSSLNFLVKLMYIKVLNGWSNKSFDLLFELLKVSFPMGTTIPD